MKIDNEWIESAVKVLTGSIVAETIILMHPSRNATASLCNGVVTITITGPMKAK